MTLSKKNLMSKGRLRIKSQPANKVNNDVSVNPVNIDIPESFSPADIILPKTEKPTIQTEILPEDTASISKTEPKTEINIEPKTEPSPAVNQYNDYHVIMTENLKTWMDESIRLLINSDIKPQKIDDFINLSKSKPDILTILARLGPEGVNTIYEIDKDDDFIRTGKIKLLSWINNLSKNKTFKSLVQKLGLAVKALRQLKKMSME